MSELPRYRCTLDKGFLAQPSEFRFPDGREGFGQRVEYGCEFATEQQPGAWMEPLNEAARERVASLVKDGKRKSERAERTLSLTPLKPPKASGLRALTDADAFNSPMVYDTVVPDDAPKHAAPKRRAQKAN